MVGSLQSKLLSGRQPLWRGHKKGSPFIYYSERISVALSESATTIFVPFAKVEIFFVTAKLLWQKLHQAVAIVPFSVLVVAIFAEKEEIWQKRETYI